MYIYNKDIPHLQQNREEFKDKCWTCKHVKQGKNGMFCGNPKQTNEELKTYVYPPIYKCNLHESYGLITTNADCLLQ